MNASLTSLSGGLRCLLTSNYRLMGYRGSEVNQNAQRAERLSLSCIGDWIATCMADRCIAVVGVAGK